MKLGFDVDGVLASFDTAFTKLLVETTKRNTFRPVNHLGPTEWDWFYQDGYTQNEVKTAWHII